MGSACPHPFQLKAFEKTDVSASSGAWTKLTHPPVLHLCPAFLLPLWARCSCPASGPLACVSVSWLVSCLKTLSSKSSPSALWFLCLSGHFIRECMAVASPGKAVLLLSPVKASGSLLSSQGYPSHPLLTLSLTLFSRELPSVLPFSRSPVTSILVQQRQLFILAGNTPPSSSYLGVLAWLLGHTFFCLLPVLCCSSPLDAGSLLLPSNVSPSGLSRCTAAWPGLYTDFT